ncbi:innexin inx2 isoform X1 [Halyomorpha halys]|uniref:innexin inx2 isoform X1 n=1 Tax=Halyomorpha halys TaxID=286706 RepID=UPI0034D1B98C
MVEDEEETLDNNMIAMKHNYYFWIPVLFVYQLFFFRYTYYVWQNRGGQLLKQLDEDKSKREMFAKYIANRFEHKLNDTWLFQLMFLEFENILVCIHHWVTTNYVLNRKFYQLGLDLSFENLKTLFPYETKFTFKTFGPSGDVQVKDYMCILGLNALYKYIFSFYWWWLAILTTLTVLNFIIRVALKMYRAKLWFIEKHMVTWILTDESWFFSLRYPDWVFMKYLYASVSMSKYRAVIRQLANPNLTKYPGEDISSGSSDDDEADGKEQEEESDRFRELLRTMIFPVPMLRILDDVDDRPGATRFRTNGNHSGPTTSASPRLLGRVPTQANLGDHRNRTETGPLQDIPDSGPRNREVSLYNFRPVQNQTNADNNMPDTDPLLNIIHDSENGSSRSDESEGVQLNFRGNTVQYRTNKNN